MSNQDLILPEGRKILPPKKRSKFSLRYIQIIVALIIIFFAYMIMTVSKYDIAMNCDRQTDICTVTKSSFIDPITVEMSKFRALTAIDVRTKSRTLENGKNVFDLELDYGEQTGSRFANFYFDNIIKANTAKMKLKKYMEDVSMKTIEIKKHCYFNEYFCF